MCLTGQKRRQSVGEERVAPRVPVGFGSGIATGRIRPNEQNHNDHSANRTPPRSQSPGQSPEHQMPNMSQPNVLSGELTMG